MPMKIFDIAKQLLNSGSNLCRNEKKSFIKDITAETKKQKAIQHRRHGEDGEDNE
jgi:hypothetical protein